MHLNRREWITGSVAFAGLAASPLRAELAEVAGVPLELVHPQLRAAIPMIEQYGKLLPPLTLANLPQLRNPIGNPFIQPPLADVPHEKRVIRGNAGQPEVAIYVINARPGSSRPRG